MKLLAVAIVVAVLAALAWALPGRAHAQDKKPAPPPVCADHGVHAGYLAQKEWAEFPAFTARIANGRSLRMYVNRKTGSWSMFIVWPSGWSCLRGWGHGFRREAGT